MSGRLLGKTLFKSENVKRDTSILERFENRHRKRKRNWEMQLILKEITPFLSADKGKKILEFGSGEGYQIPYLKTLGDLTVSDVYKSENITRKYPDLDFVTCGINNTSFETEGFDLIFSNHVLEHIEDTASAFSEMKRIGKRDCVYVFTVPTSVWILLSLPAQLYNGVRRLFDRIPKTDGRKTKGRSRQEINDWRRFMPRGHGWRKDFFDCLNSFKIKNWQRLFCENGFKIMESAPLLLYAPSELPIMPTTRFLAKKGICSSVIFIMKKMDQKAGQAEALQR